MRSGLLFIPLQLTAQVFFCENQEQAFSKASAPSHILPLKSEEEICLGKPPVLQLQPL